MLSFYPGIREITATSPVFVFGSMVFWILPPSLLGQYIRLLTVNDITSFLSNASAGFSDRHIAVTMTACK